MMIISAHFLPHITTTVPTNLKIDLMNIFYADTMSSDDCAQ